MRDYILFCLLGLGSLASAQGGKKDDGSNKYYCGKPFKKRDCAEPMGYTEEELYGTRLDVRTIDSLKVENHEDPSDEMDIWHFVRRSDAEDLQESELEDHYLMKLLGRSTLKQLDEEEDIPGLLRRVLADAQFKHNLEDELDRYDDLVKLLEKRARKYSWASRHDGKYEDKMEELLDQDGYYRFCKDEGDLIYKTPSFPKGQVIYDSADWGDCTNYDLKKGGGKDPRRKPKKKGQGDGYIAEHVFERQMIIQFSLAKFGAKIPQQQETYCLYMAKYWEGQGMTLPSGAKQVLVSDPTIPNTLPPLYLVGRAWPQTRINRAEMLTLEAMVNKAKGFLFNSKMSVSAAEHFDANSLAKVEDGHALFKISVLVAKYMAHDDVQKIYKTQGDRVAAAWEQAEDEVEKYWKNTATPYQRLGLKDIWLDWVKSYTQTVHDKLWKNIKDWDKVFEDQIKLSEKALEELKKDKKVKKEDQKLPKDHRRLLDDIKAARKWVAAQGAKPTLFKNPYDTTVASQTEDKGKSIATSV